jgi:hypothetical protein
MPFIDFNSFVLVLVVVGAIDSRKTCEWFAPF